MLLAYYPSAYYYPVDFIKLSSGIPSSNIPSDPQSDLAIPRTDMEQQAGFK